MKALVHYEMKKIWKRKSTGVVFLLMLLSIIAISLIFVSEQGCYGEDCTSLYGLDAISEKRNIEHALAGPLDPQRLQMTFQGYIENYVNQEYHRIRHTARGKRLQFCNKSKKSQKEGKENFSCPIQIPACLCYNHNTIAR